ncbi:class I SAM-dependent methyltransferase [Vibrio europaeus]|uniref:class I SAM-dependent methyltransferase n=1 Tax=Vibrio europaeus TaxID=300876 RepID=UPI0039E04ACD
MNNWKKIWGNRSLDLVEGEVSLSELISIDGFDTGYGTIKDKYWIDYVNHVKKEMAIRDGSSIYEVGCGAGAFLYDFFKKGHKVGGIDYSASLIEICKKVIKCKDVRVGEALSIQVEDKYDFIVSNSVFFYFPSLEYAEAVLEKMIEKANSGIAILEVNDYDFKEDALKLRKKHLTEEEYNKRYEGLEHLFYKRDWFYKIAQKHNLHCKIESQIIEDYQNSFYRFNVYMKKS